MPHAARTFLFVPGDRMDRFGKAVASGADIVVVDLEDAVAPEAKASARDLVARMLTAPSGAVLRINGVETPWHVDDLRLAAELGVAAVMVPKCEGPGSLASLARYAPGMAALALVETACGMDRVECIASLPGVARLVFGSIDFQLDVDIPEDDSDSLLWVRSRLVLASRVAGLPAPVDGVSVALDDEARVHQEAQRARRLGFGGKLCIHPRQVAGVNAAFTPGQAEVSWARRVIAAAEAAGGAAIRVDGRMVDRPVLALARRTLEREEQ